MFPYKHPNKSVVKWAARNQYLKQRGNGGPALLYDIEKSMKIREKDKLRKETKK